MVMDIVTWAENTLHYVDLSGSPAPLRLFDYQKQYLREFEKHRFTVICTPKRQGKTLIAAVAGLWMAMTRDGSETIVLSTSREHASGVTFRRMTQILRYTQVFYEKKSVPKNTIQTSAYNILKEVKISQTSIRFTANNSLIEAVPCTVPAVAGRIYDLLIIDELALIEDQEVAEVVIAQSERPTTKILITSTASGTDHLLYRLYQQSLEPDSDIHFIYISGELAALNNPLITERWLNMMRKQMPPAVFRNYFHNEFGARSGGRVFNEEDVLVTVWDTPSWTLKDVIRELNAVEWMVAMGIDRAMPGSEHGDLSVAVTVGRFIDKEGKVIYVVLDLTIFDEGNYKEITSHIEEMNERLRRECEEILERPVFRGLDRIQSEDYQAADLHYWATTEGYPMELVTVTKRRKHEAFAYLSRIISEHRLLIPAPYTELVDELRMLQYDEGKFCAPSGSHDDCVYALLWAIDALERPR